MVQVTQAEELLGQAGFSVKETTSALPGLLSLASAGSLDLAAATDIASGTLRAFNLQASQSGHVADVLALSASATNSDVTDLGETMKYAAPVAQALGISFEDTAAASGLLSNANIKGSQAGTVLRQTMARLASPTKEAAAVMQKYGINAFDAQGNMKPLSGVVDNLNSSLGKLTSQQRADVISTIFGTESMSGVLALMNQGGQSLSDLSKNLSSADGAAKKMADTKLDNLAGQWTILKSAVEGMKIELGERLAPYAKQFVTWFTGEIPDITNGVVGIVDTISKHTDDIKGIAIAVGSVVAAIGGLSVAGSIGNSLSGVSKLLSLFKGAGVAGEAAKAAASFNIVGLAAKALPLLFTPAGAAITAGVAATAYGVHEYNKLMDESILTAKEDLDPIERLMDSMGGNMHKTKSELQDLGLVYSDFGSDVSDSFKTAAKDASKSLLEIEMNVNRLSRNGGINNDNVGEFQNYVNQFVYSGISEMRAKQSELQQELSKTFNLDGVINESEQSTLDYLSEYYQTGVDKELEIRDEIYNIGSEAIKDHGAILDSDMEVIRSKLAEIQSLKLEYANAESKGELAYASSKFKSEAERVTGLEGASELLQDRVKTYNSQIDEAKANYDKSIAITKSLIESTDDEGTKAQLQSELDDLQKTRDESIKNAMESYKSDLETFYETNGEYKGKINEKTGEIFNKNELKSQSVMQKQEETHNGLSNITESGVYALKNSATGSLDELYVSVDENSKEIMGIYNATLDATGSYSDAEKETLNSVKDSFAEVGQEINYLTESHARLNTETGNLVTAGGSVIQTLEDVKAAADGTMTGIMEIAGTPYQITCDASGAIQSIQAVTDAANSIPSYTTANVDTNALDASQQLDGVTESANSIPSDTPANVSTNAGEQKGVIDSLLGSLQSIGGHVWNAVVNVTKNVTEAFSPSGNSESVGEHASGTDFATSGLSTVNEQGWELADRSVSIIGRYNNNPLVNLQSGTKISSHMDSVNDMRAAVKEEVAKQTPQGTYQVAQVPVQVAGPGGLSFGDTNININGNQNVEEMINQAIIQFGNTLRSAFANIK